MTATSGLLGGLALVLGTTATAGLLGGLALILGTTATAGLIGDVALAPEVTTDLLPFWLPALACLPARPLLPLCKH